MIITYDLDKRIKEKINAPIDPSLIRQRDAGRGQRLSYVTGYTVVKMLNDAFNHCWDWTVDHYSIDIVPTLEGVKPDGFVCTVLGTLTVHLFDPANEKEIVIKKQAFGSSILKGGKQDLQNIYKAASTDALKKAASFIGVAAQLSLNSEELAYFDAIEQPQLWSDEDINAHMTEFNFINELIEKNNNSFGWDEIDEMIDGYSNGSYKGWREMPPSEFTHFVEYLKKTITPEEKTSED